MEYLKNYTIFNMEIWKTSTSHSSSTNWSTKPIQRKMSQTSFSLYLHNQWTDFHKLSCTVKPQMRAIHSYAGCTKATMNDWDVRPSVAVKTLSANISWTAKQIHTIELALESAHQFVYNNIWYISKQ